MAFQQPTRQRPPRLNRPESEDGHSAVLAPRDVSAPNESQTWVLFSPGTDAATTTSFLSSDHDAQVTPGRSRISDLGSLNSATRSEFILPPPSEVIAESVAEEDAELDSLDSHLPEFRAATGPYSPYNQLESPHAVPVLPGHDGLGSFRFEAPVGMSVEAQERLYAFERFNPRRVLHRAESFDLAQLDVETEEVQELERNRRIEAWRLEQSQLLLEDIRNETKRRRRQSEASTRKSRRGSGAAQEAPARSVADQEAEDINLSGTDWHEQDGPAVSSEPRPGLWSRIARKVICDLMGIDDKLLAVLFGEALPDEEMLPSTPRASTSEATNPAPDRMELESPYDSDWQLRMLDRIARELGVFVHHMSKHPGAFSTYARVQTMTLPYAGLPVIPEAPADVSDGGQQRMDEDSSSIPAMPAFKPTVGRPPADTQSVTSAPADAASHNDQTFTQQEWEQDLDIRLVFRYLRSRFTSSRPTSPAFSTGVTSHTHPAAASSTLSAQDIAAKTARVRQHHPLVSHYHHNHHHHPHHNHHHHHQRRTFKPTVPSSGIPGTAAAAVVGIRHAPPGSCASQSTRARSRSAAAARRSSISSGGGRPSLSSRHYWDIGGSIGTGSVIGSVGGMGSWGEV